MRGNSITIKQKRAMRRLNKQGLDKHEIAFELNVGYSTVCLYLPGIKNIPKPSQPAAKRIAHKNTRIMCVSDENWDYITKLSDESRVPKVVITNTIIDAHRGSKIKRSWLGFWSWN